MKHPSVPTDVKAGININTRHPTLASWIGRALGAVLLLFVCAPAFSQNPFVGNWEGHIELPGQRLAISVELEQVGGAWRGAIVQGVTDMALGGIEIDGNVIRFVMPNVPGDPVFNGVMTEGLISGDFTQSGVTLKFTLERRLAGASARPQDPVGPFPYSSEEATFASGSISLAGTLTVPEGEAAAAVLLVSGSGPQNRDGELFGHKPFWVIADYLSRRGIAVLRVDDPGIGDSTARPESPDNADLVADAAAGIAFLRADGRFDCVGIIGHSEGGLTAATLAARGLVDFVVLLASPGAPLTEVLRRQNERILEAAQFEPDRRAHLLELLEELFDALRSSAPEVEIRRRVATIVRAQFAANGVETGSENGDLVLSGVEQAMSLRYLLKQNPGAVLAQIEVPVLALNGSLDVQIDAEQNLGAIADALARNRDATVTRLPGLNHMFQHAITGSVGEYAEIEETIAVEVLDSVAGWVLERTEGRCG